MDSAKLAKIDRYLIRRVLGAGAMGSVYAAWDPKLNREVALKVVPERIADDPMGRERFNREARAIAAARHPNIVEIYDYSGVESKHLYLVIEKLDGEDMYATMYRLGLMPEAIAAAIGHELCSALQVAHDAGIVHRDLKPENVFLNLSGRVVLTDFGIVKAVRGDSAVEGYRENTDVIGTPGFMAPELMSGKTVTPAVDIFALGALLYNITTQKLPFDGASPLEIFQASADGVFEDPRRIQPHLSEAFCSIIATCLDPNPKRRPRNAEVVRQALQTVLEDNGVTDVRDDLHDYLTNAPSYTQRAHRRGVRHVVQGLKLALFDRDVEAAARQRRRLLVLDPYNDEVSDMTGVTESRLQQLRPPPRQLRTEYSLGAPPSIGRPWLAVAAAIFLLLLGATGLRLSRPSAAPVLLTVAAIPVAAAVATAALAPTSLVAVAPGTALPLAPALALTEAPSPSPVIADVDVQVVGGGGLRLDGQELAPLASRNLHLSPGRHVFEALSSRPGRVLRRVIVVDPGDHLSIRVDPRRHEFLVRE